MEDLKVGMSFDVVNVKERTKKDFNLTCTTAVIINDDGGRYKDIYDVNGICFYLMKGEYKPIGKLTITKLK